MMVKPMATPETTMQAATIERRLSTAARQYREDLWAGQRYRPAVWIESRMQSDQLLRLPTSVRSQALYCSTHFCEQKLLNARRCRTSPNLPWQWAQWFFILSVP